MPRYKAILEYDGTNFEGWQSQPHGNTVQQFVEQSFAKINLQNIKILGSGRTDSGVHALGQVFHFDSVESFDCGKIILGLNHFLNKKSVSILTLETIDDHFDARRDAKKRTYIYKILNRTSPPTLQKNQYWHVSKKLDVNLMNDSAKFFLGEHDFTTFRSVSCEAKSPIRLIENSKIDVKEDEIYYTIQSRSFLQHQVRSMVGALKFIGEGKWTLDSLSSALAFKDRKKCATPAPSCGLYLKQVDY